MNVLIIGGSKNIGYFSAQRLLASGATVTFLLRNQSCFDDDDSIKQYISSGTAKIVQGDALHKADVERAWSASASAKNGTVDTMIFTVGGAPKFHITKGFLIDPLDLCTRAMRNVLATMPRTSPQPKIILISSFGLNKASHAALPLALKPMYSYLLASPHADKLGMERVVSHAAGWPWVDQEPSADVLPAGWQADLPEPGFLKQVLVVRPALLMDGKCKAEAVKGKNTGKGYRVASEELSGCYTISRHDVAYFIVEDALKKWDAWVGKCAAIGY